MELTKSGGGMKKTTTANTSSVGGCSSDNTDVGLSWIRGCTMKPNNVSSASKPSLKTLERRFTNGGDRDLLLGVRPQPLKPRPRRRLIRPPLVDHQQHHHRLSSSCTPTVITQHPCLNHLTPIAPTPPPQTVKASQQELQELRRRAILSMRAAIALASKSPTTHTHTPTSLSLAPHHQTPILNYDSPPICPPPQPHNHKASQQELRRLAILSMRAAIALPSTSPLSPTENHITPQHNPLDQELPIRLQLTSAPLSPDTQTETTTSFSDAPDDQTHILASQNNSRPHQHFIAEPQDDTHHGDGDPFSQTTPCSPVPCSQEDADDYCQASPMLSHHQTQIPSSQNDHSGPAADQQLIPEPESEPDQDHGEIPPCSPVPYCEVDGDFISEDHTDHDSEASPILSDDDDYELMTTDDDDFDSRTKAFIHRITAMCS